VGPVVLMRRRSHLSLPAGPHFPGARHGCEQTRRQTPAHNRLIKCGGPAPQQNNQRGIDQGRRDHQPFMYDGQQVTPMQAGNGAGWGFRLGGVWIPL
jgi:hypothetical protein